jgi:hypothetical protein
MSYKAELEERYRQARRRMGMGVNAPIIPKPLLAAALPAGGVASSTGLIPPLEVMPPEDVVAVPPVNAAKERAKTAFEENRDRVEEQNEGMPPLAPLAGFDRDDPFNAWRRLVAAVAANYGVTSADILGTSRKRNVVQARFECMYRLRVDLKMSYLNIASKMGRDHSTVIHGARTILSRLLDEARQREHRSVASAHGMVPRTRHKTPELAAA